ncbi:GAF domain-containing sensor histidine kinase [Abditibacterium utsteinense]|nr:GAF domain-containing sensor histidine kinase [Abditibacterium utsteinense]
MSDSPFDLDARTKTDLLDALAHRELQIEAMSRLSAAVFTQRGGVEALIKETLIIAMETVGASAGSLQMHDAARDHLVFRYVVGAASEQLLGFSIPASQGISGRVFRSGKSDIVSDAQSKPDFNRDVDAQTGYTTQSMATVPIKRPGASPIGVMQILNFSESYDHYDLEVLEVIAAQAAIAIDRARLEQHERKAAMVNLIGDVSHDIKNMLTPIQTGVWTLDPMLGEMFARLERVTSGLAPTERARIEDATSMVREEYGWILQNALDAAERVQIRTKEIADAVKGVSTAPRFVRADFNEVVLEVVRALRLVAHDAQIELETDLDPSLPNVEFDHKLIYNALYNLVNNAVPETPEGGRVTIKTRALAPSNSNFLVEVSDSGRGMSAEVRDKLFTDAAISTKIGGTGLGTRIVSDVVRRHKGHIAVQSEPGFGTTFTLLLPLRQE